MRGAPRDASASLSDAAAAVRGWSKAQRLLRAGEFNAFAASAKQWRSARRWLALGVRFADHDSTDPKAAGAMRDEPPAGAGLRFGLTVPRRQARRAVARNMVKRVLREAARDAAGRLQDAMGPVRADALFRLKAPLPAAAGCNWAELKRQLRAEADGLLAQLETHLMERRRAGGLAQSADAARAATPEDAPPAGSTA
jgi:RNase P protein component